MVGVEPRLDSHSGAGASLSNTAPILHVHTYRLHVHHCKIKVEMAEEKLRRTLVPGVGAARKDPPGGIKRVQLLRPGSWLWDLSLSPAVFQLLTSSWCWWRLGT